MNILALVAVVAVLATTANTTENVPPRIMTSEDHYQRAVESEREMFEKWEQEKESHWHSIGQKRITEYCPSCNDPRGSYDSSSGVHLEEGMVACKWLPNGTRLRINGDEYVVKDYCGTEAIDIFRDTDNCYCDLNTYMEVFVYEN